MKCPNAASLPVRMTWAFWTAITGAPGEAAIAAPVTVGPDELALAAASCGGGAVTPVGEECPAVGERPAPAWGVLLRAAVAVWGPPAATGKRPLTIAVKLLISYCGVVAISWLRTITDST